MTGSLQPDRHHRQTLLPQIGAAGQAALRQGHALIVGCGALGCVAAELLCRAGVGAITVIDRDVVEWTNLQRQVLFSERDAREQSPKAVAAAARLFEIDPGGHVRPIIADVTRRNVLDLVRGGGSQMLRRAGVIVDGTDNFETRYLLNDAAVSTGVPLVYAGVVGTQGLTMTIVPGASACLRCVFDTPPAVGSAQRSATCDTVGVLGPAVGAIASIQAAEAIKILAGRTVEARRTVLSVDAWTGACQDIDVSGARRDDCACCGLRRFEFLDASGDEPAKLCGRDAVQVAAPSGGSGRVDLGGLAERLARHGMFTASRFLVRGVLADERGDEGGAVGLTVFADGRAIVTGTSRPERARSIYARYLGG